MVSLKEVTSAVPRVSVVIPTFNRARELERCLDSLASQTYSSFEVLVCDDGSTDDSAAVVKSYETRLNVSYHWNENFGGPARPRNVGVELARGELIAFLDSDDWWAPDKLAISVSAIDAGADFVHHDLYLVFNALASHHWKKSKGRVMCRPVREDLLCNGNGINNSSVVTRTELMRRIGGFSEDLELIAAEDFDAWIRLSHHTDAFVWLPQCLGYYWVGSGNISSARRTISTSQVLEARYSKEMNELRARRVVIWPAYTMARAHYLSRQFEGAKYQISRVRQERAPFGLRIRVLWMSFVIWLHRAGAGR